MGAADREYGRGGRWEGGGNRLTPVVKGLLLANIALFLLDIFFRPEGGDSPLLRFGAFTIDSALFQGHLWEFLTFQFLHGSPLHLFTNGLGLYVFGPFMERWWGARKFLLFYLLCGAAGAVCFTLLTFLQVFPQGFHTYLIGASAGIYGILVGVAVVAPNLRVQLLFPPIQLSMRQLAIAALLLSLFLIVVPFDRNAGGHAGHLGGALLGLLLARFPWLLSRPRKSASEVEIIRPKAFSRRYESKIRPRTQVDLQAQSEIDAILDKISHHGFQSLTEAERETLRKASNSHHSDR